MNADSDLEDIQYAARAGAGDTHAYAWLVGRHQAAVHRYLVRLTGAPDAARDLTQDTFLRAFQAIGTWRPEAKFRTWLFRIAHNLALDYLRRARQWRRFVPLDDGLEVPDPAPGPAARLEATRDAQRLEAALAALPPAHREILLLREIEQMSYEDIARMLDLNLGTVRSRIARGRAALLAILRR
ncbi:sigma-70 family RNA polymerase sigma factor [Castellaniella sp. GW247-6E4]|uniref:RNA polymerase sigma factor n=1 Tax=Castellaniella sp. GW247-6E4 TaxID=3140380 RepID=UPI003315C1F9